MQDCSTKPFPSTPRKYPVELLDRLPACGNTWLALRGFDLNGQGIVEIDIRLIAATLSTSVGTIRNHITQGKKASLYRAVIKQSGYTYRFYLSSAYSVALQLGIERSIQTVFLEVDEIRDRKVVATEVTASVLQERSKYKAYRVRRQKEPTYLEPYLQSSEFCRGKVVWRGSRYLFITGKVPEYGGSQEGIGELIERSPSTIKRRLANTDKKQVAIRMDKWSPAKLEAVKAHMHWDADLLRYFVHCGYVFKACCNVYSVHRARANARRWNRRLLARAV